jgi:hypothetical protein
MKYQVTINQIQTVDEIQNYWKVNDYIQLLSAFGFSDAKSTDLDELRELLFMAISDYKPNEAAAIVLNYKLSEDLTEGQIDQLSNEMLIDKVCEEYPIIKLHAPLFHCNQLLYKAYNGKFLNSKATIITCKLEPFDFSENETISKEMILKILHNGFSNKNLVKRLFEEQLTTSSAFPDAEGILWELNTSDNKHFDIITSEYWLDREDFAALEFIGELVVEE